MGKVTFTNKYGLPESIVNAVKVDRHVTKGDISVTTLIDAPQVRMLKKLNDIEEDVSDRIWALFGTAIHHIIELGDVNQSSARKLIEAAAILERLAEGDPKITNGANFIRRFAMEKFPAAFNSDIVTESTLSVEVDGMRVSGTFDRLIKSMRKLQDYKSTSVGTYMYDDTKLKWEKQLNVYRYMIYKELGILVNEIEVIAILRNWKPSPFDSSAPRAPIVTVNVKVWDLEETEAYIKERVRIHTLAEMGQRVECTGEDRWASSDSFRVIKKGQKRAVRVFPSLAMAQQFMFDNQFSMPGLSIETSPGEPRRCINYCPVKNICPQHKEYLNKVTEQSQA